MKKPGATSKESITKGQPWTEEEHTQFLKGLASLGRGNWKGISRMFVPSRTPTQVASHAQKFALRHTGKSSCKRKSRFTAIEQQVLEELEEGSEPEAEAQDEPAAAPVGPAPALPLDPVPLPVALSLYLQGPAPLMPPALIVCPSFSAPLPGAAPRSPADLPAGPHLPGSFASLPQLAGPAPRPLALPFSLASSPTSSELELRRGGSHAPSTPWAALPPPPPPPPPIARPQARRLQGGAGGADAAAQSLAALTLQLLSAGRAGEGRAGATSGGGGGSAFSSFGGPAHAGRGALAGMPPTVMA